MVYNWEDLRDNRGDNHLEVEWGENIRRTRRPRGYGGGDGVNGPFMEKKKSNWLTNTIVIVSTLGTIGIATLLAFALMKAPIQQPKNDGDDASKVAKMEHIFSSPVSNAPSSAFSRSLSPTTVTPTSAPSLAPSASGTATPSIASSEYPSLSPSVVGSMIPSVFTAKAPPVPVMCVDEPGFYLNHAGDKVSCGWLSTVGTYNLHQNCEKTDIGKACLLSCREYTDCIMDTDKPTSSPSPQPSSSPSTLPTSSVMPSAGPTPVPQSSLTLEAAGDATITEGLPNAKLGGSSWLKIDNAPMSSAMLPAGKTSTYGAYHVMLHFDLSKHNANRPIESAVLRLKAGNSCSSGGYLEQTLGHHWNENSITWDNAPLGDKTKIGRLGVIKSGFWYSVDMTSVMQSLGHGTLSLRLFPDGSDECLFVSKESNNGDGPELHIEYDDV